MQKLLSYFQLLDQPLMSFYDASTIITPVKILLGSQQDSRGVRDGIPGLVYTISDYFSCQIAFLKPVQKRCNQYTIGIPLVCSSKSQKAIFSLTKMTCKLFYKKHFSFINRLYSIISLSDTFESVMYLYSNYFHMFLNPKTSHCHYQVTNLLVYSL